MVFADAENVKILKVAQMALEENVAYPILFGREERIRRIAKRMGSTWKVYRSSTPRMMNTKSSANNSARYSFNKRHRKGVNRYEGVQGDERPQSLRLHVAGTRRGRLHDQQAQPQLSRYHPPALHHRHRARREKIAGMYIMFANGGPLFLADTTVNFNPTAEELAEITCW